MLICNKNQAYYSPFDIKYKGLKLLDVPQQNISLHFPEVAQFIDEALAEGGELPLKKTLS